MDKLGSQSLVATTADGFEQATSPAGLPCLANLARRFGLHPTVEQLVRENLLTSDKVSPADIVKCADKLGLKAKSLSGTWNDVAKLGQALPAIVRLKNGQFMNLIQVGADDAGEHVVLEDPNAAENAQLTVDRARFESAWDGTLILIKRNYDIREDERPFSLGMIVSLMFKDRRMVRDVGICAVMMSVLALAPIFFWRILSDEVVTFRSFNTFYAVCIGFAALVLFEMLFSAMRRYLLLHITTRMDVKLSNFVFDRVLNLPIDFFERNSVGLIARDMHEVFKIRMLLAGQFFNTVLDSLVLLVFLPVMFYFSPALTFIVLAFCGLIAAWIMIMLPHYRRKSQAVTKADGAMRSFMIQTLQGMRTVKSLALDNRQRQKWDVLVANVARLRVEENRTSSLIQTVVLPLERCVVSGSMAVGIYWAISGNDIVSIGAIFAFMMLTNRVASPLVRLAQMMEQLDQVFASVDIVSNLVNRKPEEGRSGHGVRAPLKGHIEFSNVRFKYQGAISPALDGVTFEVPAGSSLGIMGRSGSGKTTVTRLLQRLHSDYDGLIKIDGVDVREYDVDHLRASLGVVLQDNFLFTGTIRDNITIAKPDATFEDVVRAARLAGAEEFIEKLPRGYDTFINESSSNLSGGQRQRLAIARALIMDPKVLIMDEATSALDAESEAIVNGNLDRIASGRTMVVISHRLSSLVKSDAILVLDRGRVNDIGRHGELLQRNEIYSHLWTTQNKDTDAKVVPLRNRR